MISGCEVSTSTAHLTDAKSCTGVDGNKNPVGITQTFTTNTPEIYIWFSWANAPDGTGVKAVWIYETQSATITEYPLTLNEINGKGTFSLTKPDAGWPSGDYRVDIYLDNEVSKSVSFKVDESTADKEVVKEEPVSGETSGDKTTTEKEEVSAENDLKRAIALMDSGKTRLKDVSLESGAYSASKTKLKASKTDYDEALKILNGAESENDDEKNKIEIYQVVCGYTLDEIAAVQNVITCMEYFDKAFAYVGGDNIVSARSELKLAEDALKKSQPFISEAKKKSQSIDINTVPAEFKSHIQEDKDSIEKNEKMISEFSDMISGLYPFMDGMGYMLTATDYVENEKWTKAKIEFSKAFSSFTASQNKFITLKNSQFSEISVSAIELESILTKMLVAVDHFEKGCEYADKGNLKKSEEEFDKGAAEFA